jgi:MarR family transcriptional regulator, lower aerobic nicotinate degradation pathway regulator
MEKQNEADKIVELVNLFHQYQQDQPNAEISDFCQDYLLKQDISKRLESPCDTGDFSHQYADEVIDMRLGGVLGRLSRFGLVYSRKAFQELEVNNLEDFVYLKVLENIGGTPKKSELINYCLSEFSSGIEIIKRLVALGLLEEFPDEDDKRSKRLKMTDKGREVLAETMLKMEDVSKLVYLPLSEDEKEIVLRIMQKLDRLHMGLHIQGLIKNKSLEEIAEMMKKGN